MEKAEPEKLVGTDGAVAVPVLILCTGTLGTELSTQVGNSSRVLSSEFSA